MHGAGNDFVIIDSRGRGAVMTPALARALGDRNRGVGFDQLAEIRDATDADFALDFWNSDGSRAGACGNATRCVADHVMRDLGRDRCPSGRHGASCRPNGWPTAGSA
jgi:diaminopimelate epimerase